MAYATPSGDLSTLSIGSLVWMASAQPVLDEVSEDELIGRARSGDRGALEELAMGNLRVVIDEAIRARGLGTPQDELVRLGVASLLDAARFYDPASNERFSTYVRSRVRDAFRQATSVS